MRGREAGVERTLLAEEMLRIDQIPA